MQRRNQYLIQIEESHAHLTDEELIELIKKTHGQRKIDYCMGLIGILRSRKTPLTKQLQQEFIFIAEIYTKTERCLDSFKESTEGWYVDKIDEKNTLSSKIVHRGEAVIRYDGQVDFQVFNLLTMIYQTGLYSNWVPFCGVSRDVKNLGIAAKVAYAKFNLPFISDREGYFYGQGIDRVTSTGSVVIYVEGITSNKAEEKRLGLDLVRDPKCTEMDLKFMVCEVRMLKPKSYMFRVFAHLDTKLYFMPQFVMGFFSKKFGCYLINRLLVTAANLKGTEWEKRINQSGDPFYPWLRAKMDIWQERYGKSIEPDKPPRPVGSEPPKLKEESPKKEESAKQEEVPKKDESPKEEEIVIIKKQVVSEIVPKEAQPDIIGVDKLALKDSPSNSQQTNKQTVQIIPVKANE